jgi:hypothetical protein
MIPSIPRFLVHGALAALAGVAQADVHYVDSSGGGDFTTIQAAVDASLDGDVIVVRPGSFAAFVVDDKTLSIATESGGLVLVQGTVEIRNLAAHRRVLVSGLSIQGPLTGFMTPYGKPGLKITNDLGQVWVQDADIVGGTQTGSLSAFPGGPAVDCSNAAKVSLTRSFLFGGDGWSSDDEESFGGAAGVALRAQGSALALYDCYLRGGKGGYGGSGGAGGDAAHFLDWGAFASGTRFFGGEGGTNIDYISAGGGAGGDGVQLDANAGLHALDCTFVEGAGGVGQGAPPDGPPGAATSGTGFVHLLAGAARVADVPAHAQPGSVVVFDVHGEPGDVVRLPVGLRSAFLWIPASNGVRHYPGLLLVPTDPAGVLPASGVLSVALTVPPLPSGVAAATVCGQVLCESASGTKYLGSPFQILVR